MAASAAARRDWNVNSEHPQLLATSMAELARSLHRNVPLEEILDAIVEGARDNIPGVDFASISIRHRGGRIETVAGTDQIVYTADELQYDLREGPCVDAIRGEHYVLVEDVPNDPRWPRYGAAAAALGIHSQLGIELYDDGKTVGGLNLYARRRNDLNDDSARTAYLFAVHAANALGRAMIRTQLTEALETRTVTAEACGILMERYRLDRTAAFAFLTRMSQTRNVKLRIIAQELVDEVQSERQRGSA